MLLTDNTKPYSLIRLTKNEEKQTETSKKIFEEFFDDEHYQEIKDILPTAMEETVMSSEIRKASNKTKNEKKTGYDDIRSEQLKYSPEIIENSMCETKRSIWRPKTPPPVPPLLSPSGCCWLLP